MKANRWIVRAPSQPSESLGEAEACEGSEGKMADGREATEGREAAEGPDERDGREVRRTPLRAVPAPRPLPPLQMPVRSGARAPAIAFDPWRAVDPMRR